MGAPPTQPNGSTVWRPRLPLGIVVASAVVALVAVSSLIYLLYNRTRGPAEVLREFATAVDAGDCSTAYDLLSSDSRTEIDDERFCSEELGRLDEDLDADFTLDRVVYHRRTQTADLTLAGDPSGPWRLKRHGNSWRVVLPA
ncbi:MAG TPA: hypothetical protein VG709_08395 [Actinomycetota bacterium]|nr:hypothetical protein [Actinomycetota bacterium]